MFDTQLKLVGIVCAIVAASAAPSQPTQSGMRAAVAIVANDNRASGGTLRDGVLNVNLVAGAGTWYPEERDGPGHDVYAFGEAGRALQNPGPLLRVPAGTEIRVTLRNQLAADSLMVHGLHDRPGAGEPVVIPPGDTRSIRFRVSRAGTYYYWGTTHGARALRDRWGAETQLMGALVVDPPGASPDDHIFVIGIEADSVAPPAPRPLRAAVVNGRSWPHTRQSSVTQGDTVRMRWINASDRVHPMHLHGFYFRVDRHGDIAHDTLYDAAQQRRAVTELMLPGQTMSITWVPERPGHWIMHCHMTAHIAPELRHGAERNHSHSHTRNHALEGMAGLVIGWRVLPRGEADGNKASAPELRRIRLLVQSQPGRYGADPGLGFVIQNGAPPRADSVVIPGPPLVLTRGEPVEINVVNRLAEPTSIHWHGIELDSYYDGVSGWSGAFGHVAPHIEAGDSFAVRFTPPRAGTFIYHSHFEEARQLGSGMYGPLLVLEPGARYDPESDRIWILSQDGPGLGLGSIRLMLSGSRTPVLDFEQGKRYRIRLISISPNLPLTMAVLADSVPVHWRALAKDGADLPPAQARVQPAQLLIGVGETYDFEFIAERPGELQLRATNPAGIPFLNGVVRVRAKGSSPVR